MSRTGTALRVFVLRRSFLMLLAPALLATPIMPQEHCGAAKGFMVRALERVGPGASDAETSDGLQLLKRSTQACASLGDAWYYRALFEQRLGHAPQAGFALRQARLVGSEALEQSIDPFTLSTSPQPAKASVGPVRDKWALVVGIGRFNDPSVPSLTLTAKDARDFRNLLVDSGAGRFSPGHVHLLADSEATTRRIKDEFNWLSRSATPDDLVVIYFSSHGSSGSMDVAGAHYVVTYDTAISGASDEERQNNLYGTALPMEDLASVVRNRIKALRAAVFLDTCHSGAAVGTSGQLPSAIPEASVAAGTLERIRDGTGRVVMASSRADENSYESPALKNGYFTYYLILGLRQQQGLAPLSTVYDFVRAHVAESVGEMAKGVTAVVASRTSQPGPQQHPVMLTSTGADFAIGVASTAVADLQR